MMGPILISSIIIRNVSIYRNTNWKIFWVMSSWFSIFKQVFKIFSNLFYSGSSWDRWRSFAKTKEPKIGFLSYL